MCVLVRRRTAPQPGLPDDPRTRLRVRGAHRTSYRLLEAIRRLGDVQLVSSAVLLEELADVLTQPSATKRLVIIGKTAQAVLANHVEIVEAVAPTELPRVVPGDADDDHAIAAALTSGAEIIVSGDGLKAHRSKLVREYLDSTDGEVQMAFLLPYSPDLNPVEFLWTWLKRHALANFCPANLDALNVTARNKLKSSQHRPSIIAACWTQAGLW